MISKQRIGPPFSKARNSGMRFQSLGCFSGASSVHGLGLVLAMLSITGCGVGLDQGGEVTDGNRDASLTSLLGKTSGEPNGAFSEAIVAVLDADGAARLQGTVASKGDLDVFLLGSLSPGQKVIVDAKTRGSSLDVFTAIFDSAQRLVYSHDDREGAGDRFLDSYIEWVTRHRGDRYYLVATNSAFAGSGTFTGTYNLDVQIIGGFEVPEPVMQILLLDFDGAVVDSPGLGSMTLSPFDAASIWSGYAGQTETIKETIRAVFEQNFERFNVLIVTTDDPPLANEAIVSTIFFGGFDPHAFGIAEGVDIYNAEFCDDAVIFTESFEPARVFLRIPTAANMGIAIGNVGSHEVGHLLGLNHVDDDLALMDDVSSAEAFLEDQEFMEAPLSKDIMTIGTQDAVLLLKEIVGPRPLE